MFDSTGNAGEAVAICLAIEGSDLCCLVRCRWRSGAALLRDGIGGRASIVPPNTEDFCYLLALPPPPAIVSWPSISAAAYLESPAPSIPIKAQSKPMLRSCSDRKTHKSQTQSRWLSRDKLGFSWLWPLPDDVMHRLIGSATDVTTTVATGINSCPMSSRVRTTRGLRDGVVGTSRMSVLCSFLGRRADGPEQLHPGFRMHWDSRGASCATGDQHSSTL
ncbi:hypothetical protein OH77DRAFT_1076519 [Trametes cingulata]|nr:hypothetical protein OH77DRAFT_1076519 [Trametes cingulata]